MKKLLVLLLSLVLAMGSIWMLTGCGKGGKEKIHISVHETAYDKALWTEIEAEYEKDFKDHDLVLNINSEIWTSLSTQLGTPLSPDVVFLGTNQNQNYAMNNIVKTKSDTLLLDITDILDKNVPGEDVKLKDKINPDFININATNPFDDGKTMMLPLFYTLNGIFYNKSLIGEQELPKTYADMAKITVPEGAKVFGYPRAGYLDNLMIAAAKSTLSEADFEIWKTNGYSDTMYADNGKFAQIIKDLAALKSVFMDGFTANFTDSKDTIDNTLKFYQDKVAFFACGTFQVAEAIARGYNNMTEDEINEWHEEKLGYIPYPSVEGGDNYLVGMVEQVYGIKSGDAKREANAKNFLSYLYTDKAVKIMAKHDAMVPVKEATALAKEAGMNKVTLNLYGTVDNTPFSADSFPNASVASGDYATGYKNMVAFGLNAVMGYPGGTNVPAVLADTSTGEQWFAHIKNWAKAKNNIA